MDHACTTGTALYLVHLHAVGLHAESCGTGALAHLVLLLLLPLLCTGADTRFVDRGTLSPTREQVEIVM